MKECSQTCPCQHLETALPTCLTVPTISWPGTTHSPDIGPQPPSDEGVNLRVAYLCVKQSESVSFPAKHSHQDPQTPQYKMSLRMSVGRYVVLRRCPLSASHHDLQRSLSFEFSDRKVGVLACIGKVTSAVGREKSHVVGIGGG
jgi:hypothetical protein